MSKEQRAFQRKLRILRYAEEIGHASKPNSISKSRIWASVMPTSSAARPRSTEKSNDRSNLTGGSFPNC